MYVYESGFDFLGKKSIWAKVDDSFSGISDFSKDKGVFSYTVFFGNKVYLEIAINPVDESDKADSILRDQQIDINVTDDSLKPNAQSYAMVLYEILYKLVNNGSVELVIGTIYRQIGDVYAEKARKTLLESHSGEDLSKYGTIISKLEDYVAKFKLLNDKMTKKGVSQGLYVGKSEGN